MNKNNDAQKGQTQNTALSRPQIPDTQKSHTGIPALIELPLVRLEAGPIEEVLDQLEVLVHGLFINQLVLQLGPEGELMFLEAHLNKRCVSRQF